MKPGLQYLEEQRSRPARCATPTRRQLHPDDARRMSDPGLIILPTHRLVSGLAGPDGRAAGAASWQSHFQVEKIGQGEQGARDTWELIEADGSQELLGFGTVADGVWQTARFRRRQLMAQLAAEHSADWRGLAVACCSRWCWTIAAGKLGGKPECQYVHLLARSTTRSPARQCQLAVLVPPATMGHVEQIAGNLEKMPPKSTYFYPKLLSGLVFNSLKVS